MSTPSNLGPLGLGIGARQDTHGTPPPLPTDARIVDNGTVRTTSNGAIRVVA